MSVSLSSLLQLFVIQNEQLMENFLAGVPCLHTCYILGEFSLILFVTASQVPF